MMIDSEKEKNPSKRKTSSQIPEKDAKKSKVDDKIKEENENLFFTALSGQSITWKMRRTKG